MSVEHSVGLTYEARCGELVDPIVEAAVRLLVHLESDFPLCAPLLAPESCEVLDGEARIRDHLQHSRKAAGLVDRLDDQDFRNLHAPRFLCDSGGFPSIRRRSPMRAMVIHEYGAPEVL